jgi:hypothetical protein
MDELLRGGVVFFSLLAAWFWMAAALGTTMDLHPQRVSAEQLPAHQAKWNAWATSSAGIAALCQALLYVGTNLSK